MNLGALIERQHISAHCLIKATESRLATTTVHGLVSRPAQCIGLEIISTVLDAPARLLGTPMHTQDILEILDDEDQQRRQVARSQIAKPGLPQPPQVSVEVGEIQLAESGNNGRVAAHAQL